MLETIFRGIFDTDTTAVITVSDFLLCIGCALVIGIILALGYMYRSRYTNSFVFTLVLLPAVVCVVIMMVNGNVGTGVAVAGAFSLVRFRSVPGTAKEISMLFLAMGAGLIAGMGYLGYAVLFAVLMCILCIFYNHLSSKFVKSSEKVLNITVPEALNYSEAFDELLERFTSRHSLVRVKTTNLGSLFRLTYHITMKDSTQERELIDQLRCRNGNLEISICAQETTMEL